MDADLSEGCGVAAAVEVLRATNFRLRCLEIRVATLANQSSEFRELQARVNTIALRLATADGAIAVLQSSFVNQQGISLRSEVQSISKVLTQAVEVLNRLEPELLRLLRWRQSFTSSLSVSLTSWVISLASWVLNLTSLGWMSWIELELHRMRAVPSSADLPSSASRVHLAPPGRPPSELADLAEDVSGEPVAVSSANLYPETLPRSPSEIADLTEDVSEVPASSPGKGSAESWELINTDAASSACAEVQQVCTVKRYRKHPLPLLATQPAVVPGILQAFPKVSSARSRSPGPLLAVAALQVQPCDLLHDDHRPRHRLGLGSRL